MSFEDCIRDLTGAPYEILEINDSKSLQESIQQAVKNGRLVACLAKEAGVGESQTNQIGI